MGSSPRVVVGSIAGSTKGSRVALVKEVIIVLDEEDQGDPSIFCGGDVLAGGIGQGLCSVGVVRGTIVAHARGSAVASTARASRARGGNEAEGVGDGPLVRGRVHVERGVSVRPVGQRGALFGDGHHKGFESDRIQSADDFVRLAGRVAMDQALGDVDARHQGLRQSPEGLVDHRTARAQTHHAGHAEYDRPASTRSRRRIE